MKLHVRLFLLRWHQGSEKPLPHWLERACSSDPRLRAERDAGDRLTSALRNQRAPTHEGPSPFLASRIKHGLREFTPDAAPSPVFRHGRGLAGALACTGLLACGVAWVALRDSRPAATPGSSASVASVAPSTDASTSRLPVTRLSEDTLLAGSWSNPLREEMENVVADTVGAMRFLAANFLPSSSLESLVSDDVPLPAGG